MKALVAWSPLNRPASVLGWIVTIAAVAIVVQVFLAVDARSHSASDTLYAVFPYWGVTFLLWDWITRRLRGAD